MLLGTALAVNAQNGGPGSTGKAPAAGQNDPAGAMPGRQNQEPATTGQGQARPGASEFAPGRDPGTANETNPGHDGTPPGQMMKKNNDAGSGTRL